ncbi:MAG TPA: SRPBCC family protein [Solirubrobacteraceae bacterium]|jgi:hypothetical protein|nr:SRPBCC family protein [Solirubrobacteraceae bacterium]
MRTVEAVITAPGTVEDAERAWYDTDRWQDWNDGFESVIEISGGWPEAGGQIRWRSVPAGRGDVTELVVEHEPGSGQVVEIQDETSTGRQTVTFEAAQGGVEVAVTLEYRITKRTPITPVFELLFVSRAMRASLQETLHRFAVVLGSGQ